MTPVFQTILKHDPANGVFGNCLQAAVASLLDLKLYQVPHFSDDLYGQTDAGFIEAQRVNAWFANRGMAMLNGSYTPELLAQWQNQWQKEQAEFIHLMSGLSVRGHFHATVARNGVVIHDPHPDGGGITPMEGLYQLSFVVQCQRFKGTPS